MKKNAMLKIAAVLLVAVLLTTCAISSTFAKYVSDTTTLSDTARVAKWGLTIDTTATTLSSGFNKTYGDEVSAAANVVAPGTMGTITYTVKAKGTAEVDAELRLTDKDGVCAETANYIVVEGDLADELKFYIDGAEKTLAQANAAIFALCAAQKYDAGAAVASASSVTITWKWAYEDDANEDGKFDDADDTALGEAETPANVTINISAQLVQAGPAIDEANAY